jgi:hypothetical protein
MFVDEESRLRRRLGRRKLPFYGSLDLFSASKFPEMAGKAFLG